MLKNKYLDVLFTIVCSVLICGCNTISLYEKNVSIPGHEWKSDFKPEFRFQISDTLQPYHIYIVLRHNEQYNYNNIWVNLFTKSPGDTIRQVQYELPLASKQGWMGSGMGDIYDHRIAITPQEQDLYFSRTGEYVFTLEQVMREDPLQNVIDIGIRLEKKAP